VTLKQRDRNMDNLRGFDPFNSDSEAEETAYTLYEDELEEDAGIESPPTISGDERRMQVRAYNFWTAQLHEKNYPSIEELDPENVEDFSEYSVLLDFTSGIENPSIQYVGSKLRAECGIADDITYLDQVPPRSLLSRITDHYLQIIANRAPIGFEAEFVNEQGVTIMYRGILLPYSSDDDTIDFIYGVINWKIAAEADLARALESEVEEALQAATPRTGPVPVWEDSPAGDLLGDLPVQDGAELLLDTGFAASEVQPDENSSLADWLDAARSSADGARDLDARSRDTLYRAIGKAYDFSLIAEKNAADFTDLLADAGLTRQERAPMTPVVKLVFGAGYDKTRLTEFASVLNFAHRNVMPLGGLADALTKHDGGIKAILKSERYARKMMKAGNPAIAPADPRARLRVAPPRHLQEFAGHGDEFIMLVARRQGDGSVVLIGAVDADQGMTEKALLKTMI
jgi:hypothetical protein